MINHNQWKKSSNIIKEPSIILHNCIEINIENALQLMEEVLLETDRFKRILPHRLDAIVYIKFKLGGVPNNVKKKRSGSEGVPSNCSTPFYIFNCIKSGDVLLAEKCRFFGAPRSQISRNCFIIPNKCILKRCLNKCNNITNIHHPFF